MMGFRALAILAFALAVAAQASAQNTSTTAATTTRTEQATLSALPEEAEGFSITPFLGLGFAGDFENSPTAFGVAAGYGFTEALVIEGDLYFAPDGEQGEPTPFDSSLWSLTANLLYNFPGQTGFTPYVAGGIGLLSGTADGEDLGLPEDETSNKFAWNWGGGVKSALNDRFGLRADLRFFNGDEFAPDHWRLFGGVMIRNIGR